MRCKKCLGVGKFLTKDGKLELCDECIGGHASCCEGKTCQPGESGDWPRTKKVVMKW